MRKSSSPSCASTPSGENYETAYAPAEARKVLKRFDATSQHYELRESRSYDPFEPRQPR